MTGRRRNISALGGNSELESLSTIYSQWSKRSSSLGVFFSASKVTSISLGTPSHMNPFVSEKDKRKYNNHTIHTCQSCISHDYIGLVNINEVCLVRIRREKEVINIYQDKKTTVVSVLSVLESLIDSMLSTKSQGTVMGYQSTIVKHSADLSSLVQSEACLRSMGIRYKLPLADESIDIVPLPDVMMKTSSAARSVSRYC